MIETTFAVPKEVLKSIQQKVYKMLTNDGIVLICFLIMSRSEAKSQTHTSHITDDSELATKYLPPSPPVNLGQCKYIYITMFKPCPSTLYAVFGSVHLCSPRTPDS